MSKNSLHLEIATLNVFPNVEIYNLLKTIVKLELENEKLRAENEKLRKAKNAGV